MHATRLSRLGQRLARGRDVGNHRGGRRDRPSVTEIGGPYQQRRRSKATCACRFLTSRVVAETRLVARAQNKSAVRAALSYKTAAATIRSPPRTVVANAYTVVSCGLTMPWPLASGRRRFFATRVPRGFRRCGGARILALSGNAPPHRAAFPHNA